MSEETIDIALRSPVEVARRCIILAALLRRAGIENEVGNLSADELAAEAFDLRGWLHTEGLWDDLTPAEAELLTTGVGHLDPDDLVTMIWQAAALDALGWSLGLSDPLNPAELGDTAAVLYAVPQPWDKTGDWIAGRSLRSEAEIARARESAEVWEWRVSVEIPRRESDDSEHAEIERAIAATLAESRASGLLSHGHDGDFTIAGAPISAINVDELDRLASLTTERLLALNWLCGFGESWDSVPFEV